VSTTVRWQNPTRTTFDVIRRGRETDEK